MNDMAFIRLTLRGTEQELWLKVTAIESFYSMPDKGTMVRAASGQAYGVKEGWRHILDLITKAAHIPLEPGERL